MPKPSDFYIGVVTFFSVVVPGAIIAALILRTELISNFVSDESLMSSALAGWLGFAIASYVFGHILFALGSLLDSSYDWFRGLQKDDHYQLLLDSAVSVRECYLHGKREREAINTYKWSLAILAARYPNLSKDALSIMADSKLFRSLCVATAGATAILAFQQSWLPSAIAALTSATLYVRYFGLRKKAIEQAYTYIVALDSAGSLLDPVCD